MRESKAPEQLAIAHSEERKHQVEYHDLVDAPMQRRFNA